MESIGADSAHQELAFLYMLLDSVPDSVFVLSVDGRIIYLNQAACRDLGLAKCDLLGKSIDEVDAPLYKELAGEAMAQLSSTGSIQVETTRLSGSAALADVEVSAQVAEFKGQKIVVGMLRDITERKRAEAGLRASEERYRSLVENIDLGITLIDRDHRIVMTNASHGKLFCKPVSEFVGRECFREFEKRDHICTHCPGTQAMASGQPAVVQTEGVRDDGARFAVEIHAFPVHAANGGVGGFIEVVEDIGERLLAEEAIQQYAKRLEDSNRMKDLFTDMMHHDILNPLQAAICANDLLRDQCGGAESMELINLVDSNLGKAVDLIETATRFAKLDGVEHIEREGLDLRAVVDDVVGHLAPLAHRAGMAIEDNISQPMPVRASKIIADVFANLIANAIKHAPAGRRIVVEGRDGGAFWSIDIRDFGDGIRDADKTKVFERFHRADRAAVNGAGLGLAIARRILELHDGRIRVEDNPDGGTIFVVEVPKHLD